MDSFLAGIKSESSKPKKKKKGSKKASPYNQFMSKELAKLKKEYPNKPHAERFKMAAANWKKQ
tara:strand:+ start:163 stop:351 length:189 start_codon:yes stop_codon:yes gene_type:complete